MADFTDAERQQLIALADLIRARLDDGRGFALFIFPIERPGTTLYASSAQRADVVAMLKEWIAKAPPRR